MGKTMRIEGAAVSNNPCGDFHAGEFVGTLGIRLHTRRRDRANGTVTAVDPLGITFAVSQTFGNCAKYILARGALPMRWTPPEYAAQRRLRACGNNSAAPAASPP
ncbi:hypothetical protein CDEF62S_04865 [Castellaniella defragrans]